MNIHDIFKPEYFYQPGKLVKRILPLRTCKDDNEEYAFHKLPWGCSIRVHARDEHDLMLDRLGVMDLAVTETLWRLAGADGGNVIDIGANIGYMTSVVAAKLQLAGGGKVISFEPHPAVFMELEYNINSLIPLYPDVELEYHRAAVSDKEGECTLCEPPGFAGNRGLSYVTDIESGEGEVSFRVQAVVLDDIISKAGPVSLLKVDAEGHECRILESAVASLRDKKILNIVFEEHGGYPSESTRHLEHMGYKIFRIDRSFTGPVLSSPDTDRPAVAWLPKNYLAAADPDNVIKLFAGNGWTSLKKQW